MPRLLPLIALLGLAAGCGHGGLHPSAPSRGGARMPGDPPPSRVVVHATIFPEAILKILEERIPGSGEGQVTLLGKKLTYKWTREALAISFDRGRLIATTRIQGSLRLLGERTFPIQVTIAAEPVVTPDYQLRLQSTEVEVLARGSVDRVNRTIEDRLHDTLLGLLDGFHLETRSILEGAYSRLSRPLPLPAGTPLLDAAAGKACASLRVVAVEAGPTVLARGLEKDFALVVLPSVELPCPPPPESPAPMPLLANVASLPTGPFSVAIPIAADYRELSAALERAMGGRLRFSKDHPGLYLEKPEVYPAGEQLVLKLTMGGTAHVGGVERALEGELFLSGHPRVVDNQVVVPDLELTPGTVNGLLRLKVLVDGNALRDQAQRALRVDVSERLQAVRDKLSRELSFDQERGCVRGEVLRSEVTAVYPHERFLRMYVEVSAQAAVLLPCRR